MGRYFVAAIRTCLRWSGALGAASIVGCGVLLWAALSWAPEEAVQGSIQRIFYIHVPSAICTFLAFGLSGVGGAIFLARRSALADAVALSAAEVGMVFATLVLVTGPIWAKPVWGVWWTWDARLTSMLVLWLIFGAYLLLRALVPGEPGARFASVLAIFGVLDIPFIRISTERFRTLHPGNPMKAGLDPDMHVALWIGIGAFTCLGLYLIIKRLELALLRRPEIDLSSALEPGMES